MAKMLGHCTRIMAHFEKWILAILETISYWSFYSSVKILLSPVTSLVFSECLERNLWEKPERTFQNKAAKLRD